MFGACTFFDACKDAGIKPIFGTEFYVCDDLTVKQGKTKLNHLVLLVKNEQGYKNICLLNAIAFRDGFYYKPRIDYKLLKEHTKLWEPVIKITPEFYFVKYKKYPQPFDCGYEWQG